MSSSTCRPFFTIIPALGSWFRISPGCFSGSLPSVVVNWKFSVSSSSASTSVYSLPTSWGISISWATSGVVISSQLFNSQMAPTNRATSTTAATTPFTTMALLALFRERTSSSSYS